MANKSQQIQDGEDSSDLRTIFSACCTRGRKASGNDELSNTHTRKTQQKPPFCNRDKSLITAGTVASEHSTVAD